MGLYINVDSRMKITLYWISLTSTTEHLIQLGLHWQHLQPGPKNSPNQPF